MSFAHDIGVVAAAGILSIGANWKIFEEQGKTLEKHHTTILDQGHIIERQGERLTFLEDALAGDNDRAQSSRALLTFDSPFQRDAKNNWVTVDKSALFIFTKGIVVGEFNEVCEYGNAVLSVEPGMGSGIKSGIGNCPSGDGSVTFGNHNVASGLGTSVTGGQYNEASFKYASVSGGDRNLASGPCSAVTGGQLNKASAKHSSVSGGKSNEASEYAASVTGGELNKASAEASSVTGGKSNEASGMVSFVTGGQSNEASNFLSSVLGGKLNGALGQESVVLGGLSNKAIGDSTSVVGGKRNKARKKFSVVIGE